MTNDWQKNYFQGIGLKNNFFLQYIRNFKNSVLRKDNPIFQEDKKKLNRYLTKEDMLMLNKYRKRCLKSLVIREIQVRTIIRFCISIMLEWLTLETLASTWSKWNSYTVHKNVNWHSCFQIQFGNFLKKLKIDLFDDPSFLSSSFLYSRKMKLYIHVKT